MIKVLVVEDEEKIARFIELELIHEGYKVIKVNNGREGLEIAEKGEVDLVLLDVMLPELNGLEVLRRLRKTSDIPVIMLTARDAVMDKVSGLDAGADDYITKPFAIEELLARIRTALKKRIVTAKKDEDVIKCGLLSLDKMKHKVMYDNNEIELTNREFTLLQILMENKNIVLTRDVLIEKACGYDYIGETNQKVIFDLYSGTGTIAQILAPVAKHVTGVEIVEEAVEAARVNAKLNGLDNCSFIAGDVLKVVDDLTEKPDLIVLDPPRDGIHPKALPKIIAFDVPTIVYVSCKPTSLVRDREVLEAAGYRMVKARAVDMFPATGGIETVALFLKK